ncbi:GNAT family N-acetyltransferase [Arthrobacter sp. efr-133-TYG-104]|uniref:GNAT family N-acetyltransferase n=1 Tax=Arthrobacter sp. efr-133-TYG-104 TaxID=3040324 RepID=UPI0025519608|nr:GNAT family N-acetyltransferase [Arthrobacter sp. efr-133-TYG-104]
MSTSNSSVNGGVSVQRIPVPHSPAAPGASDFHAFHELTVSHEMELWGNLDRCPTWAEAVLFWQGNDYEERHVYLAHIGGVPVGAGTLTLPISENTTTAGVDVLIRPGYRRRGLGSLILGVLEQAAYDRTRVSFDAYFGGPIAAVEAGSDILAAKSGSGGVPRSWAATCFALHHGYSLEQVETSSVLSLPIPAERRLDVEGDALRHASGYSTVTWHDACPDALIGAFARLKSLMSTEVPIAGMGWEGEQWNAARVRQEEATWDASGLRSVVAVARHDATGELAAYTAMTHRDQTPAMLYQEDTLVAPEHRGHRLGMVVKVANLRQATERWPHATAVLTWNATENQHMLAINIALGFKPSGFEGAWQKRLG